MADKTPLDLEPFKKRVVALGREGADHIDAVGGDRGKHGELLHIDGPDPECEACDDIFGHANELRELIAEIERLRSAGGE